MPRASGRMPPNCQPPPASRTSPRGHPLGAVGRGAARSAAPSRPRSPRSRSRRPPRRAAGAGGGALPLPAAGAHARRPRLLHRRARRALRRPPADLRRRPRSGKRVIFGAPDAPRATVAEAVLASCAVPWIFAPVEIDGREYVDGGVWSPTNLDAVPAGRGSRVLAPDPDRGRRDGGAAHGERRRGRLRGHGASARGAELRDDRPRRGEPRGDRPGPDGCRAGGGGCRRRLCPGPPTDLGSTVSSSGAPSRAPRPP